MSRRKRLGWVIAVELVLGLTVAGALGQGKGPPKGKGPKGPKRLKLVEEPKILKLLVQEPLQNELGLTDPQRKNIVMLTDQYRQWAENPTGNVDPATLPPRERNQLRKKLRDAESKLLERLDRALTATQWKRLWQLELQLRGVDIFLESAVAKELGLSDRQLKEIDDIRRSGLAGIEEFRQQLRGKVKGPEAKRFEEEARRAAGAEAERRIGSILTANQRARLRRFLGKPFDVSSLKGGRKGPKGKKAPRRKARPDV